MISCGQSSEVSGLKRLSKLSKLLSESSGITQLKLNTFWLINDSGNSNELFQIDASGTIIQVVAVTNAFNIDWEDLASDGDSRLFIGDFGNNHNDRKDLAIYSVDTKDIKNNRVKASKISFFYEDQHQFPPKKKKRNYDVEAFFYHNEHFYLFTKNRSSDFDGTTKLYCLPAIPGSQKAKLVGSFKTCVNEKKCKVTAADINHQGNKAVLLMHDKLLVFSEFSVDDFFSGKVKEVKLHHNSQKEAVCFGLDGKLYITDEHIKKTGGNLYQLSL